jgi:hypothetical protein
MRIDQILPLGCSIVQIRSLLVSDSHGSSHVPRDNDRRDAGGDSSAIASVAIDGPLSFNF